MTNTNTRASFWYSLLIVSLAGLGLAHAEEPIRVGSKAFTESFLLAELAAQQLEKNGHPVERRFGLGSTGVVSEALAKGDIDFYPEYTGTIGQTMFAEDGNLTYDEIAQRLSAKNLVISKPLGFNNTYGLAVNRAYGEENQLRTISDLKSVQSTVRGAFSHEFSIRKDGLRPLLETYHLSFPINRDSLEHSLAYEAISSNRADLIDVYSTDSQIKRLNLIFLVDDKTFFPDYQALYLARRDFVDKHPAAWKVLESLGGSLNQTKMRELNGNVEIQKLSFSTTIANYLGGSRLPRSFVDPDLTARIWQRTREHAFLVGFTVFIAVLTGVPLGILAVRRERLGQVLLLVSAVVQTIPSLALLCLLIPLFGIGTKPALIALYLYSLLPILLNTYIGLRSIDPRLLETAFALGLNSPQRIFWIELPLASRSILGGIKTATVIGIGTATLAALIGAGGYGAPIVSGLAINDIPTVLTGAIPAAGMSLLVYFIFEILERSIIPKGLR